MGFKQRERKRRHRAAQLEARDASRRAAPKRSASSAGRHWLTLVREPCSCNVCGGALRPGREFVYRHTPRQMLCLGCAEEQGVRTRRSLAYDKRHRRPKPEPPKPEPARRSRPPAGERAPHPSSPTPSGPALFPSQEAVARVRARELEQRRSWRFGRGQTHEREKREIARAGRLGLTAVYMAAQAASGARTWEGTLNGLEECAAA
jgi:hypothetical protein